MPWLGRERFRATVSVFPISHGEPFGVTNRVSQPHDYIYIFDNHIFDEYYCITFVIFLFLLYVYIYLHKPSQKKSHFDPESSANFSGTEGPFLGFEPHRRRT